MVSNSKRGFVVIFSSASSLALLCCLSLLRADEAPLPSEGDQELAEQLIAIAEQYNLPGLSAALLQHGKVTHAAAVGLRHVRREAPLSVADQMHLGSCTKAMTATLIAILIEDGKLSWDTTLPDALPFLRETMHDGWREATVLRLLCHRAGLPKDNFAMFQYAGEEDLPAARRDFAGKVLAKEPQSAPGEERRYSNLGYILAGAIAEEATGESWEDLMRGRLFEPLGMQSAGFGPPGAWLKTEQPWGHTRLPLLRAQPSQKDNPAILGPAGTVHANLEDWAKFVALHLGHQPPSGRILSDESLEKLHEIPYEGDTYALGWGVHQRKWAGGPALAHSGSNTAWYCVVWASPKYDFAALVCTNIGGDDAGKACDDAVGAVFSLREEKEENED